GGVRQLLLAPSLNDLAALQVGQFLADRCRRFDHGLEHCHNCLGCGSRWEGKQPAPVGSFAANAFGLHDMAGNVWKWIEDCYHQTYEGVPQDGAPWITADCRTRVVRGGSWDYNPQKPRSAYRFRVTSVDRNPFVGFQVGRTLFAGAGAITVAPGA